MNIQSIPTVYGFVDGKPIDAFQGAQPESKIDAMADKMIEATPGNEIPKIIEEAYQLLADQKFEESLKLLKISLPWIRKSKNNFWNVKKSTST